MSNLAVIEYHDQRTLTTAQLAEAYGTDTKTLSKNFERNKDRYKLGKHFIKLEGQALKEFKASRQNDDNLKFAPIVYLWTEKGAWMHAKSLNTDRAWEAYEMLVDDYYRVKEQLPGSQADIILMLAQQNAEKEQRLRLVERKVDEVDRKIDERMTLDYFQQGAISHAKKARVEYLWKHGEYNPEIHDTKNKLHAQAWTDVKRVFGVASYRDIRQSHFEEAMKYIKSWRPRLI
jgi:hypothetical protein